MILSSTSQTELWSPDKMWKNPTCVTRWEWLVWKGHRPGESTSVRL